MKRLIAFFLLVIVVLGMFVSCKDNEPEKPNVTIQVNGKEFSNDTEEKDDTADKSVFQTKNIESITFYAYYGEGKGSKVPAEKLSEYITWLGTFTIDKKAEDGMLPPGTNTYFVEIEYLDGTVIKRGLDVIDVDGTAYYLGHAAYPDSFMNIISKASLE